MRVCTCTIFKLRRSKPHPGRKPGGTVGKTTYCTFERTSNVALWYLRFVCYASNSRWQLLSIRISVYSHTFLDSCLRTTTLCERNLCCNVMMPSKKSCNCRNSRCLKLYCECFASGRYCASCNCVNCFNNLENGAARQVAVETTLERNPNAFRPKIAPRPGFVAESEASGRHNKVSLTSVSARGLHRWHLLLTLICVLGLPLQEKQLPKKGLWVLSG